jgi:hypothetical protein
MGQGAGSRVGAGRFQAMGQLVQPHLGGGLERVGDLAGLEAAAAVHAAVHAALAVRLLAVHGQVEARGIAAQVAFESKS